MSDPQVAALLAGLADEYQARYGPNDEMAVTSPDEFDPPGGAFFIVEDDGVTVAGGGFRRWSDHVAEVKRMWTSVPHRRRGHAATVLAALEAAAREQGYTALRLETGPRQPEAVSLYERHGYRRIPVYGRYPTAIVFECDLS